MIIIAVVLIGGTLGVYLSRRDSIGIKIGASIIFALIALIVFMFIHVIVFPPSVPNYHETQVELAAMRSSDSATGTFVFGTGLLEGRLDYLYYEVTTDGGYVAKKISAYNKNVVVYEDSQKGGTLVITQCQMKIKPEWVKYSAFDFYTACDTRYEFHIPEGSLIQEFRLE